jgi:hypothetical protein
MTDRLKRASERIEAGRDVKAITDLWAARVDHRRDPDALERIRELARTIHDRSDGRLRNQAANLIRDIEPTRPLAERLAGRQATQASGSSVGGEAGMGSPSVAGLWVPICVGAFAVAAVLSVIGGIVGGIAASDNLGPELRAQLEAESASADELGIDARDEGILTVWIIGGLIAASLWVGMAVLLVLLRDTALGIAALVRDQRSGARTP